MASNAPGKCCTVGVKHEGEPQGKIEQIAGYEAYVARPSGNAHTGAGVLLLTDVFGHKFKNAQLLADQFAANGYFTVAPDIVHDDPVPLNPGPGFNVMGWLNGEAPNGKVKHTPDTVFPIVDKVSQWMKTEGGVKKLGSVGYCYGAKYCVVASGKGQVDAVFVAHPSFVEEDELAALKSPMSIAAAETDHIFPAEKRHKSEEILLKTGQPYQINLYSGVEHGFAVRGDISKPQVKFGMEQAFYQAIQWFDQWLTK